MKNIKNILILLLYVFPLTSGAQMTAHFTQYTPYFQYKTYNSSTVTTKRFPYWSHTPSGTGVSTRKTCLLIGFAGTGGGANNQVYQAITNFHVDLSRVISPLTRDTFQFLCLYPYDSATNNAPPQEMLPGFIRWARATYGSTYNFDTTRVYLAGLSLGALAAEAAVSLTDSIAKYFSAIEACSGTYSPAYTWYTPGYDVPPNNPIGSGYLMQQTHTAIWETHGINDATLAYSSAVQLRDSTLKYITTNQYHFTTFYSGDGTSRDIHGGWVYNALDTFPVEPAYWSWSDGSTLGQGGKPFYGSIYNWFLLFQNELTPGGNAGNLTAMSRVPVSGGPPKILPIIKHAANVRWDENADMYVLNFEAEHTELDKYYEVLEGEDYNHLHSAGIFYPHGDGAYIETFKP